jgi:hypothetical protein
MPPPSTTGTGNSSAASSAAGQYIPVGSIAADVMEYGQSPRVAKLNKRKQDAILKDPLWWREHMQKQKPGETITYDPRMGISQAEYDELKALSGKTTIRKKSDATIQVTRRGEVYVLDGGESLPDLTGIEIDLKQDQVRTPFGVTGKSGTLTMPDTTPVGFWTGVRWSLGSAGEEGGKKVSLSLGRLKASGRGIFIYYVLNPDAPPEEKKRVNIMLTYDLPAGP